MQDARRGSFPGRPGGCRYRIRAAAHCPITAPERSSVCGAARHTCSTECFRLPFRPSQTRIATGVMSRLPWCSDPVPGVLPVPSHIPARRVRYPPQPGIPEPWEPVLQLFGAPTPAPRREPNPSRLPLEEESHHCRDDGLRALRELCVGEICRGMRHEEKGVVREPPLLGHRPPRHLEGFGHDRRGRDARLLQEDAVEHTAR